MQESVLRLFKGYFGRKSKKINKDALKYGILFLGNPGSDVVDEAIKQYGKDGLKLNQTFHKSLKKIDNASMIELVYEQIIHYITTYGFEELGIYSKETVYIPGEKLDVPELDEEKIELIIIKPLSEKEIGERIMPLANSGIALSKETVNDIVNLSHFIPRNRVSEIKNRELKIAIYEKLGIVPSDSEEFLRYLIYELTGNTLKIKNKELFEEIKVSDKAKAYELLEKYLVNERAYIRLSSIFLRNKMLFLALKVPKRLHNKYPEKIFKINTWINKIRKLADENHKPLQKDVLDLLTQNIDIENEKEEILKALELVNVFREVRVLNGISYRLFGTNKIVYKVRNGLSYATKLEANTPDYINRLQARYDVVREHLVQRVAKSVKDKKIYIPDNVSYTVPSSEKQFNGNFPEGSYLEVPRESDLIYGIHWTNLLVEKDENEFVPSEENLPFDEFNEIEDIEEVPFDIDEEDELLDEDEFVTEDDVEEIEEKEPEFEERRVDLDIKQMNKNEVFGWDSSYKTEEGTILFSGDITDAPLPNGATELFYVSKNYGNNAFLITVNAYTGSEREIPYEFIIAKIESNAKFRDQRNYMIDPNDVIEKINLTVEKGTSQSVVGLIAIGDSIKLYLSDMGQGNSRTSRRDEKTMITLDYLMSYSKIQLKLKDLLKEAGAILTDSKEDAEVDLSINAITKDSLISLLNENK